MGMGIQGFQMTANALREALVKNPYLKARSWRATTVSGHALLRGELHGRIDLGAKYRENISFATYDAGHMAYLPIDSLKKMKSDEANFMGQGLDGKLELELVWLALMPFGGLLVGVCQLQHLCFLPGLR